MVLFCDTSVLFAASGSSTGASRYIFEQAGLQNWRLTSSPWCIGETLRNLRKLPGKASGAWENEINPILEIVPDALTLDWLLVFPKTKDRPVLLAALAAEADVLLTLDKVDFQQSIGNAIYGMSIRSPGEFLVVQRKEGKL